MGGRRRLRASIVGAQLLTQQRLSPENLALVTTAVDNLNSLLGPGSSTEQIQLVSYLAQAKVRWAGWGLG